MFQLPPLAFSAPTLDSLHTPATRAFDVSMKVLRLDRINPLLSGNKWYKLRLNLDLARQRGHTRLLSFGGAWSNHLYALAAAARLHGLESVGIVRGELPRPLNPVLEFAVAQGMQLHPVSRSDYRSKDSPEFLQALRHRFGDCHVIPEGGCNAQGVRGCMELAQLLDWTPGRPGSRYVALACGTGTTLAGLLGGLSLMGEQSLPQVIGVPVLKGGGFLAEDVRALLKQCQLRDPANWHLETDFHCGGYARTPQFLLDFVRDFQSETGLPIEPVYTGKLFLALDRLIRSGRIRPGDEVIALHTGGVLPHVAAEAVAGNKAVEKFPT